MLPAQQPRFTSPPRRVPLSLAVTNVLNGWAQIGFAVFGFGMLFFWLFAANSDTSFITFHGNIRQVTGTVYAVENTKASENKQSVMANDYQYSVAGQWFHGTSYSTGHSASPGQPVRIEYLARDPSKSRISGMRTKTFGAGALVVVIFPLIGAVVAFVAMKYGAKHTDLLRHGIFALGTLKSKETTNTRVNDRPVFKLTFEFTARDGTRQKASCKTTTPDRLQDEAQEPLLYDPDDPSRAFLLDELPMRPKFDGVGELEGRGLIALLALIIPIAVVAINIWVAML